MRKLTVITLSVLLIAGIAQADGNKKGFGKDASSSTVSGQGTPGKKNTNANSGNQGQTTTETTVTVTGPRGQLKNDRTDCNNCNTTITEVVIDRPGKKR